MLNIGTTGTIYVAVESQDGRKGIDGLAGPDYSLPLPPAVRPRTQANDLSGFVLLDRSGAEKPVCFE